MARAAADGNSALMQGHRNQVSPITVVVGSERELLPIEPLQDTAVRQLPEYLGIDAMAEVLVVQLLVGVAASLGDRHDGHKGRSYRLPGWAHADPEGVAAPPHRPRTDQRQADYSERGRCGQPGSMRCATGKGFETSILGLARQMQ